MIIDSHIHLLPKAVRTDRSPYCDADPAFCQLYSSAKSKLASEEDIIAYLDASDIEYGVVFGFPWEDHDLVRQNNDEVWDFHQRYPHRIIPSAVLSTLGGDKSHSETERALAGGFAAIGELAMYHGGWSLADFEELSPSLELAATAQVPVLIHVNEPVGHHYPGKIAVDFSGLLRTIKAHDQVDFVLAHFGGGVFIYNLMPEIEKILTRTYVDTAASPYLYNDRVFEAAHLILGPDKILFGSDYPLLPLSRYRRQLDNTTLSEEDKTAIWGGNAQRLFLKTRMLENHKCSPALRGA